MSCLFMSLRQQELFVALVCVCLCVCGCLYTTGEFHKAKYLLPSMSYLGSLFYKDL